MQWTGVAVSREKRIFVNYPRWRSGVTVSVAELLSDGRVRPYPSENWNSWSDTTTDFSGRLACVQSVFVDDKNLLWVLDTGNPYLQGVRAGAAKLLCVDLSADTVRRIYTFEDLKLSAPRYLNDVRIDTDARIAYISESGVGSLIVVDLASGKSRLLLDRDASTTSETGSFVVEGRALSLKIHCDGIALSRDKAHIYYKPLSVTELYRIETRYLRDTSLPAADLSGRVQFVANVGICDGMEFGTDGSLYLTSLEHNAIKRLSPDRTLVTVVQDTRIKWPDSIAITEDGILYFTTSQIHLGAGATDPYYLFSYTE
jgi:sugar lactone lactonase YvrE